MIEAAARHPILVAHPGFAAVIFAIGSICGIIAFLWVLFVGMRK